MKHKLLIKILTILLFCTNIADGQDTCLYSHSWGFSGTSIQFKDSNNFVYHYSDCAQSKIGYGKYARSKKRLKLMFKTVEPTKNSYLLKIDSTKANSDSVVITFKVQEELNNDGIYLSTISAYDSLNKKYFGTKTNENGIGRIKVSLEDKLITFKVTSPGYKPTIFNIHVRNYDYEATINMNYWTQVGFGDGDIIEYKIGQVNDKSIKLKVGNSKYVDYKITCR